jgi:phage terminase small subunit
METDKELTDKRARFIDEYLLDCNATQAAIRAGYAVSGARQEGHRLLTNADIRKEVDERLRALAMSASEAVKHISDIAQTRLNDYLKIETRVRCPTVQQPLTEAIDEVRQQLDFEQQYTTRSITVLGLAGEELAKYQAERQRAHQKLQLQILRYELLLEQDPGAMRDIDGPPEEYEAVQVNMVALAKASNLGRIKTLSFGEFGPKVEMYAADSALDKLARMHGLYEKDNEQNAPKIIPDIKIYTGAPPLASSEKEVAL